MNPPLSALNSPRLPLKIEAKAVPIARSLNDLIPLPTFPPSLTHSVPTTLASSLFLRAHFCFWALAQAVPPTLEHFSPRYAYDSFIHMFFSQM